jgi:hypothetical protein
MIKEFTEKEKQIFDTYPKIFEDTNLSIKESCMARGIECGDGWLKIITDLCDMCEMISELDEIQVKFLQVKEKFGRLTIYYTVPNHYPRETLCLMVQACVEFAMSRSDSVCEKCGEQKSSGPTRVGSWLYGYCEECLIERGRNVYAKSFGPETGEFGDKIVGACTYLYPMLLPNRNQYLHGLNLIENENKLKYWQIGRLPASFVSSNEGVKIFDPAGGPSIAPGVILEFGDKSFKVEKIINSKEGVFLLYEEN